MNRLTKRDLAITLYDAGQSIYAIANALATRSEYVESALVAADRFGTIAIGNKRSGDQGIYVGRPSVFGNPFTHLPGARACHTVATREEAILSYQVWLCESDEGQVVLDAIRGLAKRVAKGESLTLVCWCAPLPCHAQVIREIALDMARLSTTA